MWCLERQSSLYFWLTFFWRRLFNHLFVVNTIFFFVAVIIISCLWLYYLVFHQGKLKARFTRHLMAFNQGRLTPMSTTQAVSPRVPVLFYYYYYYWLLFCNWPFHASPFLHITQIWRIPCSLSDTDDYIPGSLCTIIALTRKKWQNLMKL